MDGAGLKRALGNHSTDISSDWNADAVHDHAARRASTRRRCAVPLVPLVPKGQIVWRQMERRRDPLNIFVSEMPDAWHQIRPEILKAVLQLREAGPYHPARRQAAGSRTRRDEAPS